MNKLIGNLKTYELNKQHDQPKKENTLALKASQIDSSEEDEDMSYLTEKFHKVVRRNGGFMRRENASKPPNENELCHKCGKSNAQD